MKRTTRVEAAIRFVKECTKDKTMDFESSYPWRRDGHHILQHSLRVYAMCDEIIKRENLILTQQEVEKLSLSCILHDLGKLISNSDHAKQSCKMITDFLDHWVSDEEKEEIIYLIAHHSEKDKRCDNQLLNILKDADMMDEFGVQSLMMCSRNVDQTTPFYFKHLEKRLAERELPYGEELLKQLKHQGAKDMMAEKLLFMKNLTAHLVYENRGSIDVATYQKI